MVILHHIYKWSFYNIMHTNGHSTSYIQINRQNQYLVV